MAEPAPGRAAPDRDRSSTGSTSDDSDGSEADLEADRLAELAARLDPVPDEVTETARRAFRNRASTRKPERPKR
ncbi:MAG TPA: hypothetical protein VH914_19015 [Acidimicrobiia bacterium]|nr:hypothetical protein [Acidimicrobiia bacterium]